MSPNKLPHVWRELAEDTTRRLEKAQAEIKQAQLQKRLRELKRKLKRKWIPKQELSVEDAAKRRDALAILLAEHKSPKEISLSLGITIPEFNKLLRETPGLADEVHAIMQASAIMCRGVVHNVRYGIMTDEQADPFPRLAAANDMERAAGVNYVKEHGQPQIVIMGRDVTALVRTAKAQDLEELMRVAAEQTGMPEVKRYVEEKIAGKSVETTEEAR